MIGLELQISPSAFRSHRDDFRGYSDEEATRILNFIDYKDCAKCGLHGLREIEFGLAPPERCGGDGRDTVCLACRAKERKLAAKQNGDLRRIREVNAEGDFADWEWEDLLKKFDYRCVRCGIHAEATRDGLLTVDHVVPLSRGGTGYIDNIQPLCRSCNSWKGTRTVDYRDHPFQEASPLPGRAEFSCEHFGGEVGRCANEGGSSNVFNADRGGRSDRNRVMEADQAPSDDCAPACLQSEVTV